MAPTPLPQISSQTWEHPADRAALNALRTIPGFDEAVRKIMGFFTEKGIRQLFTASAVKVGPDQMPRLYDLHREVCQTLDWPEVPDLYVTQTPMVNAGAVGFDKPFIVVNSGTLALLDREEQRFVLAHEMGHILSGHVTYRTIAVILAGFGISMLPFLAAVLVAPLRLAFLEWFRKAEFSADRAGLLGVQDVKVAQTVFLKFAGGTGTADDPLALTAFLQQARDYEAGGDVFDKVFQLLNTVNTDHPFATVRVAELQRWVEAGGYDRVMAGQYVRRGERAPGDHVGADVREAGDYYAQQAREAAEKVGDAIARARDAFADAFKGRPGGSGPAT
jgi:Zn-dependent protease with chaperone function